MKNILLLLPLFISLSACETMNTDKLLSKDFWLPNMDTYTHIKKKDSYITREKNPRVARSFWLAINEHDELHGPELNKISGIYMYQALASKKRKLPYTKMVELLVPAYKKMLKKDEFAVQDILQGNKKIIQTGLNDAREIISKKKTLSFGYSGLGLPGYNFDKGYYDLKGHIAGPVLRTDLDTVNGEQLYHYEVHTVFDKGFSKVYLDAQKARGLRKGGGEGTIRVFGIPVKSYFRKKEGWLSMPAGTDMSQSYSFGASGAGRGIRGTRTIVLLVTGFVFSNNGGQLVSRDMSKEKINKMIAKLTK